MSIVCVCVCVCVWRGEREGVATIEIDTLE